MPSRETIQKWINALKNTDTWNASTTLPSGGVSVFQYLLDSRDENGERYYLDTDEHGNVFRVYPNR